MTLLAIDVGTTHCKAGLFTPDGSAMRVATTPTILHTAPDGSSYYDPDELVEVVGEVVRDATRGATQPMAAIGIASMAETGLLIDRQTGDPRTPLIPWFDTSSQDQAATIVENADPREIYKRFGLRVNFKNTLTKLLWLRQSEPTITDRAIWLSAADYILYRLTGVPATDVSLASRTLAYRVDQRAWDEAWLRVWGFSSDLFPPALPSGSVAGETTGTALGLPEGIPVAVSGHDHVCAALAVGAIEPGIVFDSMGTAEVLIGALPERALTDADYATGLMYGCHVARGRGYWMGNLSTSGGSIEWLRSVLGDPPLSYEAVHALLKSAPDAPTGIIYLPYLLGSGSPHPDPSIRAALVGLDASHRAGDLVKGVLEGVAYEIEFIRKAGERMTGQTIRTLVAAGGGTRNRTWLQMRADVSGCRIKALAQPEATLLGAALVAGIGSGVYRDEEEAIATMDQEPVEVYAPDPTRHAAYADLYEHRYLTLQEPLRDYHRFGAGTSESGTGTLRH